MIGFPLSAICSGSPMKMDWLHFFVLSRWKRFLKFKGRGPFKFSKKYPAAKHYTDIYRLVLPLTHLSFHWTATLKGQHRQNFVWGKATGRLDDRDISWGARDFRFLRLHISGMIFLKVYTQELNTVERNCTLTWLLWLSENCRGTPRVNLHNAYHSPGYHWLTQHERCHQHVQARQLF